MITLGIRAEPKQSAFVIYDSEEKKIINIEKLIMPLTLNLPEKLKFARNSILDIIRFFDVTSAGIRVAEGNAQNQDADRLYFEAVFMESFATSNIKSYFVGRKKSMASRLSISTDDYDAIMKDRKSFQDIGNWPRSMSQSSMEALLVAVIASL